MGGKKRRKGRNQQALLGKLAKEIKIQAKCPTLVSQLFSFCVPAKGTTGIRDLIVVCLLWEQSLMYEY